MIGGRARGSQTSLREANSASVVEAVKLYGQIMPIRTAAPHSRTGRHVVRASRPLLDSKAIARPVGLQKVPLVGLSTDQLTKFIGEALCVTGDVGS